jgi:hypothetical protein
MESILYHAQRNVTFSEKEPSSCRSKDIFQLISSQNECDAVYFGQAVKIRKKDATQMKLGEE